jgi:hypothetical protein
MPLSVGNPYFESCFSSAIKILRRDQRRASAPLPIIIVFYLAREARPCHNMKILIRQRQKRDLRYMWLRVGAPRATGKSQGGGGGGGGGEGITMRGTPEKPPRSSRGSGLTRQKRDRQMSPSTSPEFCPSPKVLAGRES